MKNLITILFAGLILIACDHEGALPISELKAPQGEAWENEGIPDDLENRTAEVIPSIQEIVSMQHAFYFLDADNYLHVYNEGRLVCPYTYDYNVAQYVAFEDLSHFTGLIGLERDTLDINDGIIDYKGDKTSPGRAVCDPGDIRRGGTNGSETTSVPCSTKGGKSGSMSCTVNTVTCVKPDGSTYKGTGSAGDCSKCKKDKKSVSGIGEIESECGD